MPSSATWTIRCSIISAPRAKSLAIAVSGAACFAAWTLDEIDRRHRRLLECCISIVLAGRLSVEEARVERFRRLVEGRSGGHRAITRTGAAYRQSYECCWHLVGGARVELPHASRLKACRSSSSRTTTCWSRSRSCGVSAREVGRRSSRSEEVGTSPPQDFHRRIDASRLCCRRGGDAGRRVEADVEARARSGFGRCG